MTQDKEPTSPSIASRVVRHIHLDRSVTSTSLHAQLFRRIRELIVSGALPPNSKLPSSRTLAEGLGVSRNCVLTAIDDLLADGWIETRRGSGAYVAQRTPRAEPPTASLAEIKDAPDAVPFRIGSPGLDLFPMRTWDRLQSRRWRRMPRSALREGEEAGWPGLRRSIAAHLAITRGLDCAPEQVFVTTSIRAGLDLAVRSLGLAGARIWVEEPGYFGCKTTLKNNGVEIVPVQIDSEGLDIEAGLAKAPDAVAALVTPACQFPTCVTMSARRREALGEWAVAGRRWILEEDHEWESVKEPSPPLFAKSFGAHTIYLGSFSRMLFPALRVSCLVVPAVLADRFAAVRAGVDGYSNTPNQMVLADFIDAGHLDDHLRLCQAAYAERKSALLDAAERELAGLVSIRPTTGGFHVIGDLAEGTGTDVARLAGRHGIDLTAIALLCEEPTPDRQILLGYTGYPPAAIRSAVSSLARLLRG